MFSGIGLSRVMLAVLGCLLATGNGLWAQSAVSVEARFVDAETGFDVPATVRGIPGQGGQAIEARILPNGRQSLRATAGRHAVEVSAPGYRPMAAPVDLSDGASLPVVFRLLPDQSRMELHPDRVLSKTRDDSTLFLGFVGDEESGRALGRVRVRAWPSGVETVTDDTGYFELHVPLPEVNGEEAQLAFERPGYQSELRRHLELWPGGDWTYRVRLARGGGERVTDERQTRRRSGAQAGAKADQRTEQRNAVEEMESPVHTEPDFLPAATSPTNLTIRVPRIIRVLYTNVVFYETMENYCRHVLPSEWFSSWGSYTGGSNSLQAGAVALRTYAIGYVNQPAAGTYDICSTTSCQVYNPAVSSSRADLAVAQTAGYVMVNSSVGITRGLTEYSAENNQLGMACGDGFTAPTGGCLSDPVCAGEAEFGHGRGMCQWGTVKWATGLKFPGNNFSNTTLTNGQPRRDWVWIVEHYYPALRLVRGTPLVVGDDVRATTANLNARACPGGGIANGVNCPVAGTVPNGTAGVILAGPEQVLADGQGYTWWQVQWSTGVTGWVVENYLARIIPLPPAPTGLAATPLSTTRVQLTWNDNSDLESGFKIERAPGLGGPWVQIGLVTTNVSAFVVSNLTAQTTYFFRVRAFNLGGDSGYSAAALAVTPSGDSLLESIADQVVDEEQTLSFTAKAIGGESVQVLADFEEFTALPANGTVLFRSPNFSGSTAVFLDASPNVAAVTGTFPAGPTGARALAVSCSFNNGTNAWLRLTTSGTATLPNPVIDLTKRLRFDIHTDRAVRVGLGVRETTNAPGTLLGSDGGSAGAIEWVGVTSRTNSQPQPVRTVSPGSWTTLTFDVPSEVVTAFANGNGVLSTASGLGVLEHLAIVPADGAGVYNVFLDNFAIVETRPFTFSLGAGAPAGAAINASSGVFSWTPGEAQGPATNLITIRVSDASVPPQTDARTFTVVVREVNRAPVLAPVAGRWIHGGTTLVVTNVASDPDLPANALVFSAAGPLPSGAVLNATSGRLTWTAPDVSTEWTNVFAIRVSDNGSPALSAPHSFTVRVTPRPAVQARHGAAGGLESRWATIPGRRYQVQSIDDLAAVNWTNVGSPMTAQGSDLLVLYPATMGQRFYRLVLLD